MFYSWPAWEHKQARLILLPFVLRACGAGNGRAGTAERGRSLPAGGAGIVVAPAQRLLPLPKLRTGWFGPRICNPFAVSLLGGTCPSGAQDKLTPSGHGTVPAPSSGKRPLQTKQ